MARMSRPWRAMMLVGVFVLAACEPGVDIAAPLVTGAHSGSVEPVQVDPVDDIAVTTVVANGLESLVAMAGPADDEGLLGAGCVIDSEEPLPDGDWFAFVLDATKHHLIVDIACVYVPGTDQFEAYSAHEDSALASYVVVNDVLDERSLRFGSDTQAYMAADNWQPRAVREVVERSQAESGPSLRGVWLKVEDGRIRAVVEPFSMGVAAG